MNTMTVIVDGKPEQREVDHVEYIERLIGPMDVLPDSFDVPKLHPGERAVRTVCGDTYIIKE